MQVHTELRVHGVSGTPPRDMLRTDPVTLDPTTEHIRIFRRPPPDRTDDASGATHEFHARAYHWGSLTTGHWLTALWILLGPFAFANVAGWMSTRPSRLTHAAVRLVGLSLTALLVAQAGYVFLEVAPALAPSQWRRVAVLVSAAVYPLVFVLALVMRLSTQSHFTELTAGERLRLNLSPLTRHLLPRPFWRDPSPAVAAGQWDDPAGSPITSGVVWTEHAILHRLRRIHLVTGLGVVVALYSAGAGVGELEILAIALAGLAIALVVLTTAAPRWRPVRMLTAWAPLIAVTAALIGYAALAGSPTPPSPWPRVHETTFVVALALGATAVGALSAGLPALGAVVTGGLFGASLGVGAGLLGERLAGLDSLTANGAGWVAVAMLLLVLFVVGVIAALALSSDPLPSDGRVSAVLHRITLRSRTLFVSIGLFGLIAGAVAFVVGCLDVCSPQMLVPPQRGSHAYPLTIGLMVVVTAVVSLVVAKVRLSLGVAVGAVGGGFVALFALARLPTVGFAGLSVDLDDLVGLSKLVVVLLPTVLVGRSMLGSIRRGTSNRQVGILWDVASLWPRWFHPLAPPAYGPMVVADLAHRLSVDPPDLLEAHSQGSVVATLAVSQMRDAPRCSLLTYGSPLGILYRQMFPKVGVDPLIAAVETRVDSRWLNLWRDTDPLGGLPIGLLDRDVRVRDGTGHSDYEITSDFAEARHRLISGES